jgi:hypothetical protein
MLVVRLRHHPLSKMLPLLVPCMVSFFSLSMPSPFRSTGLPSRLAAATSKNAAAPESSSTSYRTSHNVAVCVVPPETSANVWATVGQIRTQLRDPNFFRWPPHINLLYPFIEPVDDNVIARLALACRQSRCSTYDIAMNDFGTFGNKNRGVLWLDPVAPEAEFKDEFGVGRIWTFRVSTSVKRPFGSNHDGWISTQTGLAGQRFFFAAYRAFLDFLMFGGFTLRSYVGH